MSISDHNTTLGRMFMVDDLFLNPALTLRTLKIQTKFIFMVAVPDGICTAVS